METRVHVLPISNSNMSRLTEMKVSQVRIPITQCMMHKSASTCLPFSHNSDTSENVTFKECNLCMLSNASQIKTNVYI